MEGGTLSDTFIAPRLEDPPLSQDFDSYTKEVLRTVGAIKQECDILKRWEAVPPAELVLALRSLLHLLDGDAAHQEFAARGGQRWLAKLQCESLEEEAMDLVDSLMTSCAEWTAMWKFQFPMPASVVVDVAPPALRFDFTYLYGRETKLLETKKEVKEGKEEEKGDIHEQLTGDGKKATEAQGQPLHVYVCPVPGRMRSHEDVGWVLWPSASVVSRWIILNRDKFRGKRVLEIGSGLGLCGLVSALFASSVVLSDVNVHVLQALKRSVAINMTALRQYPHVAPREGCLWDSTATQVCTLDWNTLPADAAPDPSGLPAVLRRPFDVIVACDSVVSQADAAGFTKVIQWFLKPSGVAYVATPPTSVRWGVEHVVPSFTAAGLRVQRLPLCEDITETQVPAGEPRQESIHRKWAVPTSNLAMQQVWDHLLRGLQQQKQKQSGSAQDVGSKGDAGPGKAADGIGGGRGNRKEAFDTEISTEDIVTRWPLIRDFDAVSVGGGYEKDVVLLEVTKGATARVDAQGLQKCQH